ncbi:hypothetical protein [Saccharothrix stipae]
MTEPVPGQTPEPPAATTAPQAPEPTAPQAPEPAPAEPGPVEPEPTAAAAPTAPEPAGPGPSGPDPTPGPAAAANPQELFGSLSLSAIEADIDRLMSDKMSQLDGMLEGLEELVQRLEGEITNLEAPPDDPKPSAT